MQRNAHVDIRGSKGEAVSAVLHAMLLASPIKTTGVAKPTIKRKRSVQFPKSDSIKLAEQLC